VLVLLSSPSVCIIVGRYDMSLAISIGIEDISIEVIVQFENIDCVQI